MILTKAPPPPSRKKFPRAWVSGKHYWASKHSSLPQTSQGRGVLGNLQLGNQKPKLSLEKPRVFKGTTLAKLCILSFSLWSSGHLEYIYGSLRLLQSKRRPISGYGVGSMTLPSPKSHPGWPRAPSPDRLPVSFHEGHISP